MDELEINWVRITTYMQNVLRNSWSLHAVVDSHGQIKCLHRKCKNLCFHKIDLVEEHLFVNVIDQGYTDWILHSEPYLTLEPLHEKTYIDEDAQIEVGDDDYDEDMEEMMGDIGAKMFMDEGARDTSIANVAGHNTFACLWKDS